MPLLALLAGVGPTRMVPHATAGGRPELSLAKRVLGPRAAAGAGRSAVAGAAYDPAMLLAIDAGNTNVTIGLFRGGALVATRRAATGPRATADELELLLAGILSLDGVTITDISGVACASVVPTITHAIEAVAARRGLALVVASAATVPLPVRVDRPGEVGADRLVNALAAIRLHGAPAIVVDLGTATTFDCVAPDGSFVGGAIAAGMELGIEALAARTAQLPRIELRTPDRAIGRNTVAAIQAGTVFGYQALVNGLLARIRRELAEASGLDPADITTILTGGLAAAPWAADLEAISINDPDLTLKGLAILHAEVAGGVPLDLGLR